MVADPFLMETEPFPIRSDAWVAEQNVGRLLSHA